MSLPRAGERIRVLVSAESPVVRAGLEALLRESVRFELAGAAESADVVITESTGAELGPALILTDEPPDKPDFAQGGRGILRRSASREQILGALEAIAAGLVVIDPDHAESLSWHSTPEADAEAAGLSPRENEVLRMLADGVSNKAIAFRLGISEHTAKFHVASILAKLNAGSRTEAVTLGIRRGLIYL